MRPSSSGRGLASRLGRASGPDNSAVGPHSTGEAGRSTGADGGLRYDRAVTPAPSRQAKRDAIVDAAATVLRQHGVAGCTARAIAEEAGVAKSALHYYFEEIPQLVDLAWIRLMGDFSDRLDQVAAAVADPVAALWAAAAFYLETGMERTEHIPMMTFDYLVAAVRRGDTSVLGAVMDRVDQQFVDLVRAAGATDPELRADVLVSALVGVLVRTETHAIDPLEALRDIARIVQLEFRAPAPSVR